MDTENKAHQRAVALVQEAQKLKLKLERAQRKFQAQHIVIGKIQAPYVNNEKRVRRGEAPLEMKPHTRSVLVEGEVKQQLIEVNHYRFVGWDYGKKYTGARLRELAKQRASA